MAHQLVCPNPKCKNTDQGKILGHDVPGVYDGVLVWQCLVCLNAWPRVFGMQRRDQAAFDFAQVLNEQNRLRLETLAFHAEFGIPPDEDNPKR